METPDPRPNKVPRPLRFGDGDCRRTKHAQRAHTHTKRELGCGRFRTARVNQAGAGGDVEDTSTAEELGLKNMDAPVRKTLLSAWMRRQCPCRECLGWKGRPATQAYREEANI